MPRAIGDPRFGSAVGERERHEGRAQIVKPDLLP